MLQKIKINWQIRKLARLCDKIKVAERRYQANIIVDVVKDRTYQKYKKLFHKVFEDMTAQDCITMCITYKNARESQAATDSKYCAWSFKRVYRTYGRHKELFQ